MRTTFICERFEARFRALMSGRYCSECVLTLLPLMKLRILTECVVHSRVQAFLLAFAFAAAGCADDANDVMDAAGAGPVGSIDGGATPSIDAANSSPDTTVVAPPPSTKGPLVLITERESPEDSLQYLHVISDWPGDGKLDYTKAVELGSYVTARVSDGAIFVFQPDGATMQKYSVDANLNVKAEQKIGFASYGVGQSSGTVWGTPERAFLVDEESGQIVRWNPRTMEINGSTPIPSEVLVKNGIRAQLQQFAVVSNGRAFITASWRDWDRNDYVPGAALVYFDIASDAPELKLIHEDRCASSVAEPSVDEAGNVYVVGDGALGFDNLANTSKKSLPQCLRRVLAGKTEFDPDFFVDIAQVTGSPGFFNAFPMESGKLLVNAWAPEIKVADVADPLSPDWYWELQPYFEYTLVDLATRTSTRVSALPRAAVQWSLTLKVDGTNYVQTYRQDNGSNVFRVDPTGVVTEVLVQPAGADLQNVVRLR